MQGQKYAKFKFWLKKNCSLLPARQHSNSESLKNDLKIQKPTNCLSLLFEFFEHVIELVLKGLSIENHPETSFNVFHVCLASGLFLFISKKVAFFDLSLKLTKFQMNFKVGL